MNFIDWLLGRDEPTLPPASPSVAVSLKTGTTVLGAMVRRTDDTIILRGALVIGVDRNGAETRDRIDGDVVLPLMNIDFWQEGLDPGLLMTLED